MHTYSNKRLKETSKLLSLLLRHQPEAAHLQIDEEGWVSVNELIEKVSRYHFSISLPLLQEVVATNNKQRFAFSDDGTRIRANQGHSIAVNLHLKAVAPPELLFHGTASNNVAAIMKNGIKPMNRQHVHLSHETATATNVGQRHGKPVILRILTSQMHQEGYDFYRSKNGVWLTQEVPTAYIKTLED